MNTEVKVDEVQFSTFLVPQEIPFETNWKEVFLAKFVPIISGGITRDSASEGLLARYQGAVSYPTRVRLNIQCAVAFVRGCKQCAEDLFRLSCFQL